MSRSNTLEHTSTWDDEPEEQTEFRNQDRKDETTDDRRSEKKILYWQDRVEEPALERTQDFMVDVASEKAGREEILRFLAKQDSLTFQQGRELNAVANNGGEFSPMHRDYMPEAIERAEHEAMQGIRDLKYHENGDPVTADQKQAAYRMINEQTELLNDRIRERQEAMQQVAEEFAQAREAESERMDDSTERAVESYRDNGMSGEDAEEAIVNRMKSDWKRPMWENGEDNHPAGWSEDPSKTSATYHRGLREHDQSVMDSVRYMAMDLEEKGYDQYTVAGMVEAMDHRARELVAETQAIHYPDGDPEGRAATVREGFTLDHPDRHRDPAEFIRAIMDREVSADYTNSFLRGDYENSEMSVSDRLIAADFRAIGENQVSAYQMDGNERVKFEGIVEKNRDHMLELAGEIIEDPRQLERATAYITASSDRLAADAYTYERYETPEFTAEHILDLTQDGKEKNLFKRIGWFFRKNRKQSIRSDDYETETREVEDEEEEDTALAA